MKFSGNKKKVQNEMPRIYSYEDRIEPPIQTHPLDISGYTVFVVCLFLLILVIMFIIIIGIYYNKYVT